MIDALQSHVFDKGSAHFQPTNLEVTSIDVGNPSTNVIPAKGIAKFNLRYSDRFTRTELEQRIRDVLDSVDTNYSLAFGRGAEGFLTTPGVWTNLVATAVENIMGHKPAMTTGGGTSDARFAAKYCPVVECGMINNTIHKVDEHCTVVDLEQCDMIYREILKLYFA
jgi:succinyl-diaminopimelate desuccinylase